MRSSTLVRRNVGVAAGTALSRITGLARVVAIGAVLGGGQLADAYVSANNAPNAIYELLVGGILSAGLVPLLVDLRARNDRDGINAVLTSGVVAVGVVAVVAVALAPLVFRVLTLNADDAIDVAEFRRAGTLLARILLVQVFFYGIIALASAMLHAHRRFFAAAWSPVLANVITVVALSSLAVARPAEGWRIQDVASDARLRLLLGLGATVGIGVSAVAVVAAARRVDHDVAWRFAPRDDAVRRLIRLSAWTFGYVAVNQIALVIVQNLTEPGSGGRFAYSQAYTFFVLPHGLLAVSIATTLSPELSHAWARRAHEEFSRVLGLGIRFTLLLTVPSAVGIFVLRRPIIAALLEHGEFAAADASTVAQTLGAFALGLPAFSAYLFVLRGFYARLDTRTPFAINSIECLLNVAIGWFLVQRYGVPGLAASFSIAYGVSAVGAAALLIRRTDGFETRRTIVSLARVLIAALVMGGVTLVIRDTIGDGSGLAAATRVAAAVVAGVITYLAAMTALGSADLADVIRMLRRRPLRNHPSGGPNHPDERR